MKHTVGIIGVGMIGGSLGMALARNGNTVIGYDADPSMKPGQTVCDVRLVDSVAQLAAEVDIIILATPFSSLSETLTQLRQTADLSNKVISDVISIKHAVVKVMHAVFGSALTCFVPGHPIAGNEGSGAAFADANLFVDQTVVLCPLPDTGAQALAMIRSLWLEVGAEITLMDCVAHDQVLALTSHLPHVLVYALMRYLCTTERRGDLLRYAAGGFQDFTRVAASDPVMWRDICLGNREYILHALEGFQDHLRDLARQLKDGDNEAVLNFFTQARQYKKQFIG